MPGDTRKVCGATLQSGFWIVSGVRDGRAGFLTTMGHTRLNNSLDYPAIFCFN